MNDDTPAIAVDRLTLRFDQYVVQRDISFSVKRGEIFMIMGGSGCGKSTILRAMIGLLQPAEGSIRYDGTELWDQDEEGRAVLQRRFGVLFQSGALWSSMTLAENIALPLTQYTSLGRSEISSIVSLKLALVGLGGFEDYFPSEISGGMKKRAGLARAMALDPSILFFDEPSAGLDPITSSQLDDLIIELSRSLGITFVVVTHELPSIYKISDRVVMLDKNTKSIIAEGKPDYLRDNSDNPWVRQFFKRES